MVRQLRLAILILSAALSASAADARDAQVLDRQIVNSREERIVFRLGRNVGRLSEISFRTGSEPMLLRSVEIVFGNGERQTVDLVDWIGPGQESRPIDLAGESRHVEQIVVWKRPSWRPGRSELQVLGVVPDGGDGDVASDRLEVVDTQIVDSRLDRIVFNLGRSEGRLAGIKFRAPADWLLLSGVEIDYGRGVKQTLNFVERLSPGKESRLLAFEGAARRIETITLWKRPSWRPGRVRIDLIGLARAERPEIPPWGGAGTQIPRGWVLFGVQTVDFAVDRDVIPVGAEVGRFERIALRVRDNDIFLREITVVYANGERDRKIIETEIRADSQTRAIDLQGDRFIDRIELVYRSRPSGWDPAVVEVYGDFAGDWLGERGQRREHTSGWVLLGAQRTSIFSVDSDGLAVGERFGRFKALRLTVKRHAVRVYGMRITYGNGEVEQVPVGGELGDGQSTPPLDLRGRGRYIDRIELRYRPKLNLKGSGIVQVWGLQ